MDNLGIKEQLALQDLQALTEPQGQMVPLVLQEVRELLVLQGSKDRSVRLANRVRTETPEHQDKMDRRDNLDHPEFGVQMDKLETQGSKVLKDPMGFQVLMVRQEPQEHQDRMVSRALLDRQGL